MYLTLAVLPEVCQASKRKHKANVMKQEWDATLCLSTLTKRRAQLHRTSASELIRFRVANVVNSFKSEATALCRRNRSA